MGRVLVTGPPGSGKTTLTLRAVDLLRQRGESLAGFVTHEIRRGGRRTGFTITGLGGLERRLAVLGSGPPRVGRYTVDIDALEEVALLELENGLELGATLVVDEIGKMELLSPAFVHLLPRIMSAPRVLATIHAQSHPVTDALRGGPGVRLVHLDAVDRDQVAEQIVEMVVTPL